MLSLNQHGQIANSAQPNLPLRARGRHPWVEGTGTDVNLWFYCGDDTYEQCPGVAGTSNPRYMKIHVLITENHFGTAFAHDVYLSISEIRKLGGWDMGSPSVDPNDPANSAWIHREKQFVERDLNQWNITYPANFQTKARKPNGKVFNITIPHGRYTTWNNTVRKFLGGSGGRAFKPTRHSTVALTKPLYITSLTTREDLIRSRFGLEVREFIEKAIAEANQSSGENNLGWKLCYWEYAEDPQGYLELSVDPFKIFTTWIHESDWDTYMKGLAQDNGSAIRPFITLDTMGAYEALDDLLVAVGERDIMIQNASEEKRKAMGITQAQYEEDLADAKAFNRKVSAAAQEKRLLGVDALEKSHGFRNGVTVIETELGVEKMDEASGKRSGEQSQKTVMGNTSASKIAAVLDWENTRLKSGFFPSEWLHLAAFSWGGHLPTNVSGGYCTSQNLENLVFGTSETNSLMTRYETAWQNLFKFEQKLINEFYKDSEPLIGDLLIACNHPEVPIRFDKHEDGKYRFTHLEFPAKLVTAFNELANENMIPKSRRLLCPYLNNNDDIAKRLKSLLSLDQDRSMPPWSQMLILAHDFPFIVYSIFYRIKLRVPSRLLSDAQPEAGFIFFPFHRSFYHEAEAVLDAVVWEYLKKGAVLVAKNEHPSTVQIKNVSSKKPSLQPESQTNPLREIHEIFEQRKTIVANTSKGRRVDNAVEGAKLGFKRRQENLSANLASP